MTAFPEALDQVVCGIGIVLDDQNVHEWRKFTVLRPGGR
jgi:hypothetical protein